MDTVEHLVKISIWRYNPKSLMVSRPNQASGKVSNSQDESSSKSLTLKNEEYAVKGTDVHPGTKTRATIS
jgi:hypothetical protein